MKLHAAIIIVAVAICGAARAQTSGAFVTTDGAGLVTRPSGFWTNNAAAGRAAWGLDSTVSSNQVPGITASSPGASRYYGTDTNGVRGYWPLPAGGGGGGGLGDMLKTDYDIDGDGVVDEAEAVAWAAITGIPSTFTPSAHTHTAADITGGVLAPARLGTGSPGAGTWLRGDGAWSPIAVADLADMTATGEALAAAADAAAVRSIAGIAIGSTAGTYAAGDDTRFLSTGQKSALTGGGNSSDHFHDADRNRANHIGTQTRDTISNFAHQSTHQSGGADALTGNIDATARTVLRKNSGADVGSRRRINFIEGSGVSLTIADDPGNEELDVVFNSTGGDNATNVVLLDGDQTIGGNKTFSGATSFNSLNVGSLTVTNGAAALASLGGQPADPDLSDVADGEFTGSKVGPGINAGNVTTGTLAPARMGSGTPSAANYLRGDGIWQPVAGSSFAWSVDTVVGATNVNSDAFIPVWTHAIPAGETHVIESSVAYAGQTNLANFLLRAVLANRAGTGAGFNNAVVSSQASAGYAVAHWTNIGTNMVLLVRTPSNEPVSVHAWGLLRRMTNAGTYGGPPATYLFWKDFEDVGLPSGSYELTAGGSLNYESTSGPLAGSTEHLTADATSGAAQLLIQLPADSGEFTVYFAHKRASVTSTLRRMFQVLDASTNALAFLQTASGSTGFRGYHGGFSNTVANSFSSLSGVWTHNWVTYRKGTGADGYLRWLVATNDAATGTTAEVVLSTGTSTGDARFIAVGHNSTLSTTFSYDHVGARAGTNSITSPPQAP